jgi:hypothetical protein
MPLTIVESVPVVCATEGTEPDARMDAEQAIIAAFHRIEGPDGVEMPALDAPWTCSRS